ncbi:hypothetical protein DFH08DRAFT_963469 [Mycena albidolilacea]|uniref:Uncharacterized protein n=1 Tax=Mycena albidolilacea TaxID=1033008 RepID=A0AAD6ZV56_9AGAR|nr:hypothetical protein DFH08DRAFT_963469 [Mycena albidolilacea]
MASPHSAGLLVYRLLLYLSKNLNIDPAEFLDHPLLQAQTLVPYVHLFCLLKSFSESFSEAFSGDFKRLFWPSCLN